MLGRLLATLLALSFLAAACGSDEEASGAEPPSEDADADVDTDADTAESDADEAAAADGERDEEDTVAAEDEAASFPVSIEHTFGATEVPSLPERVVSASGTMTGHLLNVGAPVVAAQVLAPNSPLSDGSGFLLQWGQVATEAGVEPIAGPEVNVEAIAAAEPDLIIGTSFGNDAITEDLYALLSEIAPTIAIDSSGMEWQELALLLGQATGHIGEAEAAIDDFEASVEAASAEIDTTHPVVPAVVSGEGGVNVLTADSPIGQLLTSLGYEVLNIDGSDQVGEAGQGERSDVVSVSPENVVDLLGDATLLWVFATEEQVPGLIETYPTLGALPSVAEGRDIPLGAESFRIDRYSADLVVERVVAAQS